MTAIAASSARCKTLADGTLQLTVNIELNDAIAAFGLFGSPGVPMALAALKVGHAAKSDEPADKPKGGTLAQSAGIICNEPEFQRFALAQGHVESADGAAGLIRAVCYVASRAELDHDAKAATRYGRLMEKYREYLSRRSRVSVA